MPIKASHRRFLIIAAVAALLGGCSTAASMRVEVEVYKGPLSQTRPSQYAELSGAMLEARTAFKSWRRLADTALQALDYSTNKVTAEAYFELLDTRRQAQHLVGVIETHLCNFAVANIRSIKSGMSNCAKVVAFDGLDRLLGSEQGVENGLLTTTVTWDELSAQKSHRESFLAGAVEVAARMKTKGFYKAYEHLPHLPAKKRIKQLMLGWTTLTSTYSNEISARATTLLKQVRALDESDEASAPIEGRKLSVGDHLRNANPTDFLHLLDWYNTVEPRHEIVEGLTEADRVRLGQRLFADQFWSKVNEVQASGQGEVRMAFIRDAIGNWNLKEFDNNPEELLSAYRDVAKAGFELAKNAAKEAATSGTGVALSTADKLINSDFGGNDPAPVDTNPQIAVLRDRLDGDLGQIVLQLQNAKTAHEAKKTEINDQAAKSRQAIKEREIKSREETIAGFDKPPTPEQQTEIDRLNKEIADLNADKKGVSSELDKVGEKQVADLALEETSYKALVVSLVEQATNDIRSHIKILDGLKAAEVASVPTVNDSVN